MSTRINPDFYGAENTFIDIQGGDSKHSVYSLATLFTNGIYTGGQFDTTAAPWGCGKSSFSSDYTFFAGKGQNWTVLDLYNSKKNTPMFMYWASYPPMSGDVPDLVGEAWSVANYTRGLYKARMSPDVTYSSGAFKSTLSIDSNQDIAIGGGDVPFYPITYLDYQKIRAVITDVYYKPDGATNNQKTTMSAIKNGTVSVDTIVAFKVLIYHKDSPLNAYPLYIGVGGAELDMPELYRTCYYGDDVEKWVRTWRYVQTFGYWEVSGSYGYQYNSTDNFNTTSYFDTRSADNKVNRNSATSAWGHILPDTQTFEDVTYTWHTGLYIVDTNDPQNLSNKIENGDLYASGLVGSYAYLTVDEYTGNKNAAAFNAILHEVAYIGLPFTYSTDYVGQDIGTSEIYLPVFDEHMITTGNFLSGAPSLNLPNADWTDVFSEDMPEYDPDYEPEPPEPGEEDQGDLSNTYPNRYSNAGGLAQYVVDQSILLQLAAFLNGAYLPTAADLDADFKGTNPMDYIVSVQKYPFTLPNVGTSSDIYIGKNNTSLQGKKLFPDFGGLSPIAINSASTFDFGSISIPYYFNDFRDYQSKIFLFMPFIGTDELDPRLYLGHALSLVYRVDYNTGSVIAEIKRDGLTMETKTGTISITVPFLAANMGAYQNQLAQLSYSKDMTKIKGIGTALSAGFTMAAGASGTLSSGQFPLAAASNLTQAGVQLAANATQLSQLDYQIEHTAPQLGTISTAGAATAFFMDDRARIIIARPKMLEGYNSEQYSHTIGNACCKTGTLSAFSGYTQAATAILDDVHTKQSNRQATEQERQLLRRALQNGIYL